MRAEAALSLSARKVEKGMRSQPVHVDISQGQGQGQEHDVNKNRACTTFPPAAAASANANHSGRDAACAAAVPFGSVVFCDVTYDAVSACVVSEELDLEEQEIDDGGGLNKEKGAVLRICVCDRVA